MKLHLIAAASAALLATGAMAQTSSHNPAVKDSHVGHVAAPAHGANSFSEDQAKGRIAKAGYTRVSKLTKDDNGVWQGTATRGGKQVRVGLDYKGNVTTR